MKLRYIVAASVLAVALGAVGIAAALDGGSPDDQAGPTDPGLIDESPYVGLSIDSAIALAVDEGREWRIAREDDQTFALTDDLVAGRVTFQVDDGIVTAADFGPEPPDTGFDPATGGSSEEFVGLSEQDATALAEQQGRPWRVGRRDAETFALTADLMPGRITFEIDGGVVTAAEIERPSGPGDAGRTPDLGRADLIADALRRLVTTDNSFGGRDVFDEFLVGSVVGGDQPTELTPLDRDFITAALSDLGDVVFVADADAEIQARFDAPSPGTAVLSVDDLLLLDDRAEAEVALWCGSLCAVFLTYEAVPDDGGWLITGTTGPIAVS